VADGETESCSKALAVVHIDHVVGVAVPECEVVCPPVQKVRSTTVELSPGAIMQVYLSTIRSLCFRLLLLAVLC
jgi:hypothetical protein